MHWYVYPLAGLSGLLALVVLAIVIWWRHPDIKVVSEQFRRQRERLEAQFFTAASQSGKPRGLRWKAIEWERPVEFGREPDTGKIAALVGITIQFEAVEGSDMEGLPAVGNLRNATAVFFYHRGLWHTLGRTIFNMNPDEAIDHFKYERLQIDGV